MAALCNQGKGRRLDVRRIAACPIPLYSWRRKVIPACGETLAGRVVRQRFAAGLLPAVKFGDLVKDLAPMPLGLFAARKFFAANSAREDFLNDGTTKDGSASVVMLAAASKTTVKVVYLHTRKNGHGGRRRRMNGCTKLAACVLIAGRSPKRPALVNVKIRIRETRQVCRSLGSRTCKICYCENSRVRLGVRLGSWPLGFPAGCRVCCRSCDERSRRVKAAGNAFRKYNGEVVRGGH